MGTKRMTITTVFPTGAKRRDIGTGESAYSGYQTRRKKRRQTEIQQGRRQAKQPVMKRWAMSCIFELRSLTTACSNITKASMENDVVVICAVIDDRQYRHHCNTAGQHNIARVPAVRRYASCHRIKPTAKIRHAVSAYVQVTGHAKPADK